MCRIGSDAAEDELEGQRSCRRGRPDIRSVKPKATGLMAAAFPGFVEIFHPAEAATLIGPAARRGGGENGLAALAPE